MSSMQRWCEIYGWCVHISKRIIYHEVPTKEEMMSNEMLLSYVITHEYTHKRMRKNREGRMHCWKRIVHPWSDWPRTWIRVSEAAKWLLGTQHFFIYNGQWNQGNFNRPSHVGWLLHYWSRRPLPLLTDAARKSNLSPSAVASRPTTANTSASVADIPNMPSSLGAFRPMWCGSYHNWKLLKAS